MRERTGAQAEMRTREQPEAEILAVSEREQRRIGHDLHDTLCQHLTATAIAGEVLREQLAPGEVRKARMPAWCWPEEGISMARHTARGLAPIELEPDGLMQALAELALPARRSAPFVPLPLPGPGADARSHTAVQLFRIVQEAVTNVSKHACASTSRSPYVRRMARPSGSGGG